MPSKSHQLILALIIKKMKLQGYEIIAYDGDYSKIEKINLKLPFTVIRHRPDTIGLTPDMKCICIGEAKTASDLRSKRTKEELIDFSAALSENVETKLIIGYPLSAEHLLFKTIYELNLQNNNNIEYMPVPAELCSNG